MKAAIKRSRETGLLDRPGAQQVDVKPVAIQPVAKGYQSSLFDFAIPLVLLILIAIYTFVDGVALIFCLLFRSR